MTSDRVDVDIDFDPDIDFVELGLEKSQISDENEAKIAEIMKELSEMSDGDFRRAFHKIMGETPVADPMSREWVEHQNRMSAFCKEISRRRGLPLYAY